MNRIPMGRANIVKDLIEVSPGRFAEAIYFNREEKQVICFSTQLNCAVGCGFCASPGEGTTVNLSVDEMMVQVNHMMTYARTWKTMLFSIMGEGEPLLNYRNVLDVIRRLPEVHKWCKISLSTSGAAPDKIMRLAEENLIVPFKLQISLHTLDETTRKTLMPLAKGIDEIKNALDYYHAKKPDAPVELNFALLAGVNDTFEDARKIVEVFPNEYIKISKYNPIIRNDFESAEPGVINAFVEFLRDRDMTVEYHETDGSGVAGACGQTRGMRT